MDTVYIVNPYKCVRIDKISNHEIIGRDNKTGIELFHIDTEKIGYPCEIIREDFEIVKSGAPIIQVNLSV